MVIAPRPHSPPRLSARLDALRDKYFVGRATELAAFRAALQRETSDQPVALFFVHGPGGVGKSVLLRQFAHVAIEKGASVVTLDARDIEPSPAGFLRALRTGLGLDESGSPLEALTQLERPVLLVDTCEMLAPLDTWLREVFLPQLPDRSLVVLGHRQVGEGRGRMAPCQPSPLPTCRRTVAIATRLKSSAMPCGSTSASA